MDLHFRSRSACARWRARLAHRHRSKLWLNWECTARARHRRTFFVSLTCSNQLLNALLVASLAIRPITRSIVADCCCIAAIQCSQPSKEAAANRSIIRLMTLSIRRCIDRCRTVHASHVPKTDAVRMCSRRSTVFRLLFREATLSTRPKKHCMSCRFKRRANARATTETCRRCSRRV